MKLFRNVHQAEMKYDFYFMRSRRRKETEEIDLETYRKNLQERRLKYKESLNMNS